MNIGRRKTARADRMVPTPTPSPEQIASLNRVTRVRERMAQRLAALDAEIARLLAEARAESPAWIVAKLDMWTAAKERRAGYVEAMSEALDAMREEAWAEPDGDDGADAGEP